MEALNAFAPAASSGATVAAGRFEDTRFDDGKTPLSKRGFVFLGPDESKKGEKSRPYRKFRSAP